MKWVFVACALLALPGSAAAQHKTGEQVVGNVKECYYSYLGKTYVHTVAAYFLEEYNTSRPHQGRRCYEAMQTLIESVPLAREKVLVA